MMSRIKPMMDLPSRVQRLVPGSGVVSLELEFELLHVPCQVFQTDLSEGAL